MIRHKDLYEMCENYKCGCECDFDRNCFKVDKDWINDYHKIIVRKAHWIISSDGYYPYCSNCLDRPDRMTKYCCNCGCLMEGTK